MVLVDGLGGCVETGEEVHDVAERLERATQIRPQKPGWGDDGDAHEGSVLLARCC
jgi:hypothetical protein